MLLIFLYSLLLIPKEKIMKNSKNGYGLLNTILFMKSILLIVNLSISLGGYLGIRLNGKYEKFTTIILRFATKAMIYV